MRAIRLCTVLAAVFAAWATAAATAQDLLAPPPDLSLDELGELPRSLMRPNSGLDLPSQAVTRGQAEEVERGAMLDPMPEDRMMIYDPAVVWSSRSWLDRGYWYAVDEVVITTREYDRRNTLLARDPSSGRTLQIRSRHPGAVANARLGIGRFLFRDTENRDHLLEATFFGFGKERQSASVTSLAANSLVTDDGPFGPIDAGLALGNRDFDGSNSQSYNFTHEVESLEFNYRIKGRLDRDRMVLRPSGEWVREAQPGMLKEFIAGVRWFSMDEWLNWDATGPRNGSFDIKANNDLLGIQLGGGASQAFARWDLNVKGLAGAYVDFARVNRDFVVRDNATVIASDDLRVEEEDVAFMGEFQAYLRYHIHQNFSFRFGYQLMYLDSVAVAPFQITFTPNFEQVGLSGSSLYMGFLVGVEGYW